MNGTFNPYHSYSSVLQQQGRVALDSDASPSWANILKVDFDLAASHDFPVGTTAGRHQDSPVKITRETDSASPLFRQALVTNKILRKVTIYLTNFAGVPYTLILTNATITSIKRALVSGTKSPCELVELSYEAKRTVIGKHGS